MVACFDALQKLKKSPKAHMVINDVHAEIEIIHDGVYMLEDLGGYPATLEVSDPPRFKKAKTKTNTSSGASKSAQSKKRDTDAWFEHFFESTL
ncbi:MAG: hypothetical protein QNK11_01580 [Legionella sp.]|nr:hypothetical protein [Legionella sp.]